MTNILYQGHGSLRLTTKNGNVIYVDPFAGDGYEVPADLILVTHNHYDHNKVDLPQKKSNCRIITFADALKDGKYNTFDLGWCVVTATVAQNKNHKRNACVGFLIETDGKKFYFAGDTSFVQEMDLLKEQNIEVAFLPTDGVYNMDAEHAAICAQHINAKYAVPIHTHEGMLFDAKIAAKFDYKNKIIMNAGEQKSF